MAITATGLIQLGFKPDIDFRVENDGSGAKIVSWTSASPQPSVSDIEAADATYNTEYDAKAYARTRAAAYPSIGDQLDMLWHAVDTGYWTAAKVKTTEFYTALKAVKDANPKP